MMTITYKLSNSLYLNITNRCPCNCTFCIRHNGDGAYGSDSLWLEHQPTADEVIAALKEHDLSSYDEIIFCGFGEPTCELDILIKAAEYIKSVCTTPIRLNTNGLSDRINKKPTANLLKGLIDTVSISLNAPEEEEYNAVTKPSFDNAFESMLAFAVDCKGYVNSVMLTVVDVIPKEQIEASKKLADKLGIQLRVREYSE